MTSTAKNFAGQNLRGRSFKCQDLSGADFSGADLRGTDFTDAILREANFSKAKTGVQKRWLAFQLVISFVIAALSGFLAAFAGLWVALFLTPNYIKDFTIIPAIAMIFIIAVLFFAIIRQGFTAEAFGTVALAVAVAVAGAVALAGAGAVAVAGAVALAGALAGAGAWAGALAGAGAVDGAGAVALDGEFGVDWAVAVG